MGIAIFDSSLQNKLIRLCQNNGWSFAVLLSLDHRNPSIVGQIAPCSMKHKWVFSDDDDNGCMNLEFQHHFEKGIKTVALIALETIGLQIGSNKKIYETIEFVDRAKRFLKEIEEASSNVFSPNSFICNSELFHPQFASFFNQQNLSSQTNDEKLEDSMSVKEEEIIERRGSLLRSVKKRDKQQRTQRKLRERIAELRKLIPNGGKMSIDSLLVQTVEHMLLLEVQMNYEFEDSRDNSELEQQIGRSLLSSLRRRPST